MRYINQIVYVNNARNINHAAFCNGHYGIIIATPKMISNYPDFDYCLYFADQSIIDHGREYWYFMEDEIAGNFPDGIRGD